MYCKSCGKEIPDRVRFCSNCVADNGSGSFEDKAASAADMAVDAVRDAAQSVDSAVDELLGSLLCGVGSCILVKNVNLICSGYSRRNGLV